MGSWEASYKADRGLYQDLEQCSITGNDVNKGELNGYMRIINNNNVIASPGADVTVTGISGELPIGDIPQGVIRDLFGFKLYQNGEFTNKYICCRAEAIIIRTAVDNIQRYYQIKWSIFDSSNNSYTDVISYMVEVGLGQVGSIKWTDMKAYVCFQTQTETHWNTGSQQMLYGGLYLYANSSNYGGSYIGKSAGLQGIGLKQHLNGYTLSIEEVLTSPEFGKSAKKKGGYNPHHHRKGTFDDSSDKITPSSAPVLSPLASNFFHAYVVTTASLQYIADALFPQPVWTQSDLISMMGEVGQVIFFNKQMDYLLDLLILPIAVPHGDWTAIRVGGKELKTVIEGTTYTINGQPPTSCYVDVTCGALTIPEYWANFLDFSGTRIKLFLPYVGYVDIQPEYINGGELKVDYRFNIIDGSFMAYVRSTSGHSELDESLIGQYAGIAAVHVPLQGQDYSNKISGLISAIGSVAAAGLSGGASLGVGAASSLANTMVSKPGSNNANGYNASSSFLSHRKPYLIIERQSSQFSEKYPEEKGLPLFIKAKINDCHGLTVCDNPHLDTIPATMEEKERIFKYLTEGIIV